MSITIKCYSERGMCVKGITADQADLILGALGKGVYQYNPMMGGYVFSRKREAQIRALVAGMQAGRSEVAGMPESASDSVPRALNAESDDLHAMDKRIAGVKDREIAEDARTRELLAKADSIPIDAGVVADDLPGKWGVLAE